MRARWTGRARRPGGRGPHRRRRAPARADRRRRLGRGHGRADRGGHGRADPGGRVAARRRPSSRRRRSTGRSTRGRRSPSSRTSTPGRTGRSKLVDQFTAETGHQGQRAVVLRGPLLRQDGADDPLRRRGRLLPADGLHGVHAVQLGPHRAPHPVPERPDEDLGRLRLRRLPGGLPRRRALSARRPERAAVRDPDLVRDLHPLLQQGPRERRSRRPSPTSSPTRSRITAEKGAEGISGSVMRGIRLRHDHGHALGRRLELVRLGRRAHAVRHVVRRAWDKPRLTDERVCGGLANYGKLLAAGPANKYAIDWPDANTLFSQGKAAYFIDASLFGPELRGSRRPPRSPGSRLRRPPAAGRRRRVLHRPLALGPRRSRRARPTRTPPGTSSSG